MITELLDSQLTVIERAQKRFKLGESAEKDNRLAGLEALDFLGGNQWPQKVSTDRQADARPCLTINHTYTYRTRVVNSMRQQRPRIKTHPVGSNSDVRTSEMLNGLIRNIESQSHASIAYDRGVEKAVDIGWGYWRVNTKYEDEKSFDQICTIEPIRNPFTVVKDPMSELPDGSDSMWYVVSETMTNDRFAQLYPGRDMLSYAFVTSGMDDPDWLTNDMIRVAEYWEIELAKDELLLISDGSIKFASEAKELTSEVLEKNGLTIEDRRPTWRRVVHWYKLTSKEVIDHRVWAGKYIPIIACYGREIESNGSIQRFGMIKDMMDPARMVNYWRTTETESIALAPKAPWLVAAGQVKGREAVWNEANRKSYAYLEYNPISLDGTPVPPPQRQPMPEIPAGVVNAAQGAMADLMSVAGQDNDPNLDNRQGQVVSGIALDRRTSAMDLNHFDFYDNQLLSIRFTGIVLLDLIPKIYDTARMVRIIADDGTPSMVKINEQTADKIKNDVRVGRYDVVMDTGPDYKTGRSESTEKMLGLLNTPLGEKIVTTSDDLIMRNIDVPGGAAIADRLAAANPLSNIDATSEVPPQAQMQIQSLTQQVQQLHQQNMALELEIKSKKSIEDGWMRTEIHKELIKAGLVKEGHEVKRFDVESRDSTKLAVAEISGATQLLNTHAEAEHDAKAADKLIEAGEREVNKDE